MVGGMEVKPPKTVKPPVAPDATGLIFTAIMAALTGECDCPACRILRRVGREMVKAMLEVVEGGGGRTQA